MSGELEHLLSSKSALLSPPSLRLRRRCARHPATSVTCGSMHRCGYTVLPVGSTKPLEAVFFAVSVTVDAAAAVAPGSK